MLATLRKAILSFGGLMAGIISGYVVFAPDNGELPVGASVLATPARVRSITIARNAQPAAAQTEELSLVQTQLTYEKAIRDGALGTRVEAPMGLDKKFTDSAAIAAVLKSHLADNGFSKVCPQFSSSASRVARARQNT